MNDYRDLEDEFAATPSASQASGAKSAGGSRKQAARTMLLSVQRAQNVGVLLAKLKMSPAQV